jgi:hypothetical protein
VVKVPVSRAMPKGRVVAGKSTGRVSFQLFDTRKHFEELRATVATGKVGRIYCFRDSQLVPLFQSPPH